MTSHAPALNTGLQGIRRGLTAVGREASRIAGQNPDDLAAPLARLQQHRLQVETSARVVETASGMLGTLLDVKA